MSLLKKFDELLGHLNAEENGLAMEFRKALSDKLDEAELDALWRSCLESGGVDNWSWYSESLEEYWNREEELEEERAND